MNYLNIIKTTRDFLWGYPLIITIFITGIILTIKLKGLQITKLKEALFILFKKDKTKNISTFQAVCISLSATLGSGNIVGVATAITIGGPGALIWLIITILIGLPIKYMESYLSTKYKVKECGGPYFYIELGMPKKYKVLAKLYATFGMFAAILGFGTFIQINGITDAFKNIIDKDIYIKNIFGNNISISSLIIGFIFSVLTFVVIIGGTKKIAKYSEICIPIVAILYISTCIIIVLFNIKELPKTLYIILKDSLNIKAITSGVFAYTIREGVSKGIFASEAGVGTSGIAISTSDDNNPHNQGLASMASTIFGTTFICILTGIVIVITNAYRQNLTGISIASFAFKEGTPLPSQILLIILLICIIFFGYTTMIGWNLYGVKCLKYMIKSEKIEQLYQWIYIMMIFIGAFLNTEDIWNISEIFNALMVIPNIIAILYIIKKEKIYTS